MLNYALFMQMKEHLLSSSALTAKLKLASGSFYEACLKYFNTLQTFADEHKLYISTDIATVIEKMSVYVGEPRTSDSTFVVRRNPRKEKDSYAVGCLDSIRKGIKAFLEKDYKSYDDCGDIWRQVVSRLICKINNISTIAANKKVDFILSAITSDAELLPYYSHVVGILGVFNAKALLDTILPSLGL